MPEKMKHIATGRTGKVMSITSIPLIGDDDRHYTADMYELAFDGQLWTECFFDSEVSACEQAG
jgi:hypothetical protein